MKKSFALGGLAALGLAIGVGAHAAEPGFYAGIGIGQANLKIEGDEPDDADFDGEDMAFKLYGGYTFNQYFGVEVAYFDSGEPDDSDGLGTTLEYGLDGANVSLMGTLPVTDAFSVFAKLGYAFYDIEVAVRRPGNVFTVNGDEEDLSYGIGAAFSFAGPFEIRAEYEALDIDEEVDVHFDTFSISGSYRF